MSDSCNSQKTAIIDGANVALYWRNNGPKTSGSNKVRIDYIETIATQLAANGYRVRLVVDDSLVDEIKDDRPNRILLDNLMSKYQGVSHHHADDVIRDFLAEDRENHFVVTCDKFKGKVAKKSQRIEFLIADGKSILLYTGQRFESLEMPHTLLSSRFKMNDLLAALGSIKNPDLRLSTVKMFITPIWHFRYWINDTPRRGKAYPDDAVEVYGEAIYNETGKALIGVKHASRFLNFLHDIDKLERNIKSFSSADNEILPLLVSGPARIVLSSIKEALSKCHEKSIAYRKDRPPESWAPYPRNIDVTERVAYLVPYALIRYSAFGQQKTAFINAAIYSLEDIRNEIDSGVAKIEASIEQENAKKQGLIKEEAARKAKARWTAVFAVVFCLSLLLFACTWLNQMRSQYPAYESTHEESLTQSNQNRSIYSSTVIMYSGQTERQVEKAVVREITEIKSFESTVWAVSIAITFKDNPTKPYAQAVWASDGLGLSGTEPPDSRIKLTLADGTVKYFAYKE